MLAKNTITIYSDISHAGQNTTKKLFTRKKKKQEMKRNFDKLLTLTPL